MGSVVAGGLLLVVAVKLVALCCSLPTLLTKGPQIVTRLRETGTLESANFSAQINPVDRALDSWASSERRRTALVFFTLPVLISASAAGVLLIHSADVLTLVV